MALGIPVRTGSVRGAKAALLCACALLPAVAAAAQGAPDGEPTEQDVVVTATRRDEAQATVPISLVALTRESLDEDRIQTVDDLARAVPGLALRGAFGGTTRIAVRGIASVVGSATTGIYIDDTPIQVRTLGAADVFANAYPEIFDLDRVEVLRGPQGTLFGTGSEGGTVRFITADPLLARTSLYTKSSVALTKGGDPSFLGGASLSVPLIEDRAALRLSGSHRRDGGWIDREPVSGTEDGGRDVNSRTASTFRAAGLLAPTDTIRIRPSLFVQRVRRSDTDQYWESLSDPDSGRLVSGQPLRQPSTDRFLLPALAIEADLGFATLVSNSSLFDRDNTSTVDYSILIVEGLTRGALTLVPFVPDFTAGARFDIDQRSLVQEFRLQSNAGGAVDWTAGLFYSDARQTVDQAVVSERFEDFAQIVLGCPAAILCFGQAPLPGDTVYAGKDESRDRQYAGFGQIDWRIAGGLTATLGARLTHNEGRFDNLQDGPFNFGPSASSGTTENSVVTPRFGLSWQRGPMLAYASAARGARPGGGNTSVPYALCAADLGALGLGEVPATFGADGVWTYEAGAKGRGRGFNAAVSAFYTDWNSIQQPVALPNCGFQYTANLGDAVSRGFDAAIEFRPVRSLNLEASLAYTDAEYDGAVTTDAGTLLVSSGDALAVPPWEARLSATWSMPLRGADASIQADYDYSSAYRRTPSAPAFGFDPFNERAAATHLVGVRARIDADAWEASLFIDNLLDSTDPLFRTHDSPLSPTFRRTGFRPRTMGLELRTRF